MGDTILRRVAEIEKSGDLKNSDLYQDPEGELVIENLATGHNHELAQQLAADETYFYHPASVKVLRYLYNWTWDPLNSSGYRMVVVYLWGVRYSGKSTTLRQLKILIYQTIKKRMALLKKQGKIIPDTLTSELRNISNSIVYFELPTGMESDKRLFHTILTTKFGMSDQKKIYNQQSAFDLVRKLMEICLIQNIRIIIIDEFDRLENYGSAEKVLNHLHYLSNGENWENLFQELKKQGKIKKKSPFTRFILCGISSQIPLLEGVNWNDDRITEIKLETLTDEEVIPLLSKVAKRYREVYQLNNWNIFNYDAEGNLIGYDKGEIELLKEYSEMKAGKLLETVKKAGVVALKNNDTSIRESYYNFARLKTNFVPNIETIFTSNESVVICEYCSGEYKKKGIKTHQRSCRERSL